MEPKLLTAERFVDQRIGCMYRYVLSETEYFRPHYHDYFEVFLVLSGQATHLINGSKQPLMPRDLVFIRPQDCHDHIRLGKESFSMLNITFTHETAEELFSFLGAGFPSEELLNMPMPPQVQLTNGEFSVLNSRMKAISAIPYTEENVLKTALRVFLFDLFTGYFSDCISRKDVIPGWLEELCFRMRTDGNFIEGSEKLFALTDKSREHVCRSMKKYMGLTVTEFINDLRLNYIANMLRNSNHSITDIVYESGFNNMSWTTALFKKKYGMTMRQYRK